MTVRTVKEAWKIADERFPTDYQKNETASGRAGYPIYTSTASDCTAWISDLGTALEINYPDGKTERINIADDYFSEYQIMDALEQIDEAIYQFEDKIDNNLLSKIGLSDTIHDLYNAIDRLDEIASKYHPTSKLFEKYRFE